MTGPPKTHLKHRKHLSFGIRLDVGRGGGEKKQISGVTHRSFASKKGISMASQPNPPECNPFQK